MKKSSDTSIQAVGRTLSTRNVTRLKTAWTEIGTVLLDAGVIDKNVLDDLEGGEEEVKAASADSVEELPEVEESPELIAAEKPNNFLRQVKLRNWSTQLNTTLRLFGQRYERLHLAPDEQLTREHMVDAEVSREDALVQVRSDLESLLKELSRDHPGAADPVPYYKPATYMSMAGLDSDQPSETGEVAAARESFISEAKRSSWHTRLETTLRFFRNQFELLHICPDDELARQVDDVPRSDAIAQLQEDLMLLLKELSADHPGVQNQDVYGEYFELSRAEDFPAAPEGVDSGGEISAAGEEEVPQTLILNCSTVSIQLNAAKAGARSGKNRRGFEGVLFLVDEPSESAPSVGPKLPLYIPRDVGERALLACAGLPLDADNSLGKHASEEIAGVMMSSQMVGNEARVQGLLYDWSQGEKVSAIAANKHKLGMSMNAEATGHEATVDNQKVFWIDSLDLMGGNILYANRATYQKTRVLHAGTTDETDEELVDIDLEAIAAANDLDGELDLLEESEAEAMIHIASALESQASVLNANLQSLLSQLTTT